MNFKKKILAVVSALTVASAALTGCGGEQLIPADQTIGAIFELTAKNNPAPMKDLLGFASEEDVKSTFLAESTDQELVEQFQEQFSAEGLNMSNESVQAFADALEGMLGKLTYTAEITSEEKNKVVVSLKVNSFSADDMTQVTADALVAMQEKLTEEDQMAIMNGDTDVLTSYMEGYFADLVAGLSALELSEDAVDIEVPCEKMLVDVSGKDKTAWMPSDLSGFYDDIENCIFH
ncbi:MAG: hypothetical protein NC400_09850 [Clostridium sp.]|nr:hypothetical protein [Clostridium sp.]